MFGKKQNEIINEDFGVYVVYDQKAGVYKKPVLVENQVDLIREYEAMCKDPKANQDLVVTNAEDFKMFKIGSFCKRTGRLVAIDSEHIFNFIELRTMVNQKAEQEWLKLQSKNQEGALSST